MERPILFNTSMVRAIQEGRKTVTRRAIRPQPDGRPIRMTENSCYPGCYAIEGTPRVIRPPCQTGDILWVRETWARLPASPGGHFRPNGVYYYRADEDIRPEQYKSSGWRPAIHMPKAKQDITADEGYDALSQVTVEAIPAEYADVSGVTAAAGDVLANKVFVGADGAEAAGTMPNNGAVQASIDGLTQTEYTVPAGYHTGTGKVSLTGDIEEALAAI